ncbi:molybdenum ABC transporter ATP-binding protein [Sneathiella limimaris]|uniref:molybdenum ABC transporter ATP-binding protein n=1 Tax=Sneathiella limimaris TaxID=1964213 RepID=UPI00146F5BD9|nr:molybdenum ABC transporter ATP-binding protein [Sneathiella limimaris]
MLIARIVKKLRPFTLDCELTVEPGITAIFGPSGAGKTQLVRLLSGLDTPDEGMIEMIGRPLFESGPNGGAVLNVKAEARKIGHVFQQHLLFPHLSVRKNLLYGRPTSPKLDFNEIVDTLGIADLLDRKPVNLSGGESQRVAIGRTLLSEPDLIIMDEPLASLDSAIKQDIMGLIEKLRDSYGLTILYITHALPEVMRLADNLILLEGGKCLAAGPTGEILSRHDLALTDDSLEIGTVFNGTIAHQDPELKLTQLETDAGLLEVTGLSQKAIGDPVRIRLRAKDITIATEDINLISTLNRLKGKVTDIQKTGSGTVFLKVDVGIQLNAAITLKSLNLLKLEIGMPVWALIKSVTVNSIER